MSSSYFPAGAVASACSAGLSAGATFAKNAESLLNITPTVAISFALKAPLVEATSIMVARFFKFAMVRSGPAPAGAVVDSGAEVAVEAVAAAVSFLVSFFAFAIVFVSPNCN
jgi:hypothetical protein